MEDAFTFEDRARHIQDSDAHAQKLEDYIEHLKSLEATGNFAGRIPSFHTLKKWRRPSQREKIFATVSSESLPPVVWVKRVLTIPMAVLLGRGGRAFAAKTSTAGKQCRAGRPGPEAIL